MNTNGFIFQITCWNVLGPRSSISGVRNPDFLGEVKTSDILILHGVEEICPLAAQWALG